MRPLPGRLSAGKLPRSCLGLGSGLVESDIAKQEAASFLRRKPKTSNGGKGIIRRTLAQAVTKVTQLGVW